MSGKEFTYSRIDMDRPSFRLIRLLGGDATEISCELFEAYLDDSYKDGIPYEALSYTWGDIELTATIRINGMKARVTENLFMALHYLRLVDGDRILWIDAVCIDQGHDRERGHQVRQMGDIYEKADNVIVWLGIGTEDTDSLMYFLTNLPPAHELVPEAVRIHYCELLRDLLRRPWFRRVWVIQEVAKAQRAIVVCGWKSVSTRIFTSAPSMFGLEPESHIKAVLDVMPGRLRASSWFEQQPTLRTLLQKFHGSQASDERDMIYALLGMSSSVHERSILQADYEMDLRVLIQNTTSTLLFPALLISPHLRYIDWTWFEFVQNLTALRTAAFMCVLKNQIAAEWFIENSWNGPEWQDFDVGYKDRHDQTPLIIAAQQGYDGVVRLLLEQDGIDINVQDENGRTALWVAAEQNHENVVRLMAERDDIDIDKKDNHDRTPFWKAALEGHDGVVESLLEHGDIDIDARDEDGVTPLWNAARQGHEDILRLLIERGGIDINVQNKQGQTPLWIAARYGLIDIVRLLVEQRGISLNVRSNDGRRASQIAAWHGHEDVVGLLAKRSRFNAKFRDGVIPSCTTA